MKTYKIYGAAITLIVLLSLPTGSSAQNNSISSDSKIFDIPALVYELNQDREAVGLAPMRRSNTLDFAAQLKAQDMVEKGYFSHISPEGVEPWHWFEQSGYNYQYAGENLAFDFYDPADVQEAWMNSPDHRKNILNKNYEEVGYAVAYGEFKNIGKDGANRKGVIVVQLFGKSMQEKNNQYLTVNYVPSPASSTAVYQNELARLDIVRDVQNFLSEYYTSTPANEVKSNQTFFVKNYNSVSSSPAVDWPLLSLALMAMMLTAGIHTKLV